MMIRAALCLLAIPLLAACGGENAEAPAMGEDSRSAEGDVLAGSISDDMLPLDQLESTSPAAKETSSSSPPSPSRAPEAAEPAAEETPQPATTETAGAPAPADPSNEDSE